LFSENNMTPNARATGTELALDPAVAAALRERLAEVAAETVAAVTVEVPSYAGALAGDLGENITGAVQIALGGFLKLATRSVGTDPGTPLAPALDAAYSLGRGEARSGRSMDALLAAYRVGARVAWREMSTVAAEAGMPARTVAQFAELVFAYIDELSGASVSGHTDELATTGRVRERYLERLTMLLLARADDDVLHAAAARADWSTPATLTAVLLPAGQAHGLLSALPDGTVLSRSDLPGLDDEADLVLLLVPDSGGSRRARLIRALRGRDAVVGPARPWTSVAASYERAVRTRALGLRAGVVDSDEHLAALVLDADRAAHDDLRARVLAPLADLRPATAARLEETLRSWLLHQGRRDDVAAELFVHAQTVRYRMGQIRELYGDALDDPAAVRDLVIALAHTPAGSAAPTSA
jgi:hypothetical protein